MVLSAAWVMRLSSLRSSLRFQRSVDLNSSVFDSPCSISSLGAAVAAQVLVEQEILDHLAEGAVVSDALVQVEVGVDDLLDHLVDLVIESQAHVFARVDPRRGVERGITVELVHHLFDRDPVFGAKLDTEPLVQLGDDPG